MPGFRTLGLSLALSCVLLAGCTSSEAGSSDQAEAGGAGGSSNTLTPTSLAFEGLGEPANLPLKPSDTYALRVVARPPGVYPIRFGLLGDTGGASLDRTEAETDAEGAAEVVLTAPKTVELFSVRASVGTGIEAKAVVRVGESFATLQVRPNYPGKRPIAYWVATAHTGESCDNLPVDPPEGSLVDQAIPSDDPPDLPTLTSVPTGTELVVTLRAARYIQGCAVVSNLVRDKINELVVPVRDVPLKVGGADLDVVLTIDPARANLDALLDRAEAVMFERFNQGHASDVTTLLDAMAEATEPAQKSGFVTQRSRGQWDFWVGLKLGLGASTEMQRPLRGWFATARAQLFEREMLSGRLLTTAISGDAAELRLTQTFGYDPSTAGFSPADRTRLTVTAEPGDNLVVGGAFDWFPTQLLGRFVADVATAAAAGSSSGPEALASALSCNEVAAELADHGTDSNQVFPGCDLGCATQLCKTAVQNLWKRMTDVTGTEPAKLALSATGYARVDDHANVASVSNGAWSANVDFATVTGKLTGNLDATAVPRPPTQ